MTSGNGELVAFAVAGCGEAVCSPLWTSAPSGLSLFTPTIANGVVYVGALDFIYLKGDVLAYPTTCIDGCEPLATLVLGGANETPVAVAGGRIYATTVNGNIDSLGLAPVVRASIETLAVSPGSKFRPSPRDRLSPSFFPCFSSSRSIA